MFYWVCCSGELGHVWEGDGLRVQSQHQIRVLPSPTAYVGTCGEHTHISIHSFSSEHFIHILHLAACLLQSFPPMSVMKPLVGAKICPHLFMQHLYLHIFINKKTLLRSVLFSIYICIPLQDLFVSSSCYRQNCAAHGGLFVNYLLLYNLHVYMSQDKRWRWRTSSFFAPNKLVWRLIFVAVCVCSVVYIDR